MKAFKCLLILLLITTASYGQAGKRLTGKWQQREESGSDGAKSYTVPVKDGPVIVFGKDNSVAYNNAKGTFVLAEGNKLTIDLGKDKRYYLVYFGKSDNVMYLNPVTPDFQIICDEGCADIYYKVSY